MSAINIGHKPITHFNCNHKNNFYENDASLYALSLVIEYDVCASPMAPAILQYLLWLGRFRFQRPAIITPPLETMPVNKSTTHYNIAVGGGALYNSTAHPMLPLVEERCFILPPGAVTRRLVQMRWKTIHSVAAM